LLDQLCAAGLMRRDEDPEDRRAKTVVLTDEGRAVTAKMEEELVTLRAQALKGVSRSDLEAALRVFEAFTTDPASVERETRQTKEQPRNKRPKPPVKRTKRTAATASTPAPSKRQRASTKAKNTPRAADQPAPRDADDPA
jgi:MarR family transcriptional regulator, transcriptional regulator for hemolysin